VANITLLPAAQADYQQALNWYQGRSQRAAAGFEAAVDVALKRIASAPEQWAWCDDRHRFYILRRYPYSIIYRLEGEDVLVVAIAHSSRSASYWQGRD
jgi:plasmid stabilization system protein ParE